MMARYWIHNNMITINGKKMGKSYNNVIKLTELFSGQHPLLTQPYAPMTIRFFILQSHYRGTLDFSNEALQGSEKALKRLLEAHEWLMQQQDMGSDDAGITDAELNSKVEKLVNGFTEFMNDDMNTAKVLANMFELVPVINSIKDKHQPADVLNRHTATHLQAQMRLFVEDIFGLKQERTGNDDKLDGVLQLLIDIRKEAKKRKDFVTSDKIRNELSALGVQLKDEKDGEMSYSMS
jgi:cysteinyl-tRNA synthetase